MGVKPRPTVAARSPGGHAERRGSPDACCAGWWTSPWSRSGRLISRALADRALTRLGVDKLGLDGADRRYLTLLAENYGGGPVGVETIAAALCEPRMRSKR